MNWVSLIKDLSARRWTQSMLADHCGVSQGAISDLSRGEIKNPSFSVGDALRRLHESGEHAPLKAAA